MGTGPRRSAGRLPAEGRAFKAGQLPKGGECSAATFGESAGGPAQTVGSALLVSKLLRGVLRRRAAGDRQTVHRATVRYGFLPAVNDGVSALEIL